jgi:hypothetical protein
MDNSLMIRHAARMVRSIAAGQWTNAFPYWADANRNNAFESCHSSDDDVNYTRAVQTAEAFILLFLKFDPTFNDAAFLRACNLR